MSGACKVTAGIVDRNFEFQDSRGIYFINEGEKSTLKG
jgi:hypothetical protein